MVRGRECFLSPLVTVRTDLVVILVGFFSERSASKTEPPEPSSVVSPSWSVTETCEDFSIELLYHPFSVCRRMTATTQPQHLERFTIVFMMSLNHPHGQTPPTSLWAHNYPRLYCLIKLHPSVLPPFIFFN